MDKLNDFLKELKMRLSNPLIFSYLFSWIFINWQVTIALLFYKMDELSKDGYSSYTDVIRKNFNGWKYYVIPAAVAVFYTFGFPFIRSWIKQFQAWLNGRTDNKIIEISKTISIPMERYLRDRQFYLSNTEELKNVMEKESQTLIESQALRAERNQLQERLNEYSKKSNINFMNGYWDVRHTLDGEVKTERINLSNGTFYRTAKNSATEQSWMRIRNYGINLGTQELIIIVDQFNKNPSFTSVLRYQGEDNLILKDFEENAQLIQMDKFGLPKREVKTSIQ